MQPLSSNGKGLYQGVVFAISKSKGVLKVHESPVFQDKASAVRYFKGIVDYDYPEGCRIAKVIIGPNGLMNAKGVPMTKVAMEGEEKWTGKDLYAYRNKPIDIGIPEEVVADDSA